MTRVLCLANCVHPARNSRRRRPSRRRGRRALGEASLSVTAPYAPHEGEYVPYILGAPERVNAPFRELFPDGLPALTPLAIRREAPATGTNSDGDAGQ